MKLTLKIPTKLKDITLSQYQQWLKIAEGQEMSLFLQQKMIEIFCNVTLKDVLKIRATDVDEITSSIEKIFIEEAPFINKFELNEKKFGFIYDLDKITLGEFADLDKLTEWQSMHKAMGVLYRPIVFSKKEKYLIEDYESSVKYDMKKMTLEIVFGALVFFWNLKKEYLNLIQKFLVKEELVESLPELKDSAKNMGGLVPSMRFVKEMLEGLKK